MSLSIITKEQGSGLKTQKDNVIQLRSCSNCISFDNLEFECTDPESLFFGKLDDCEYNKKLYKLCFCNKHKFKKQS